LAQSLPALALTGIRVIHLGTVWAPSVTAHLLGDFGAEVIHIESASRPDIQRSMGATLRGEPLQNARSHCTFRNQQSCALDMRSDRGLGLLKRLIAQSDVVIENYSPGALARYGLDYPSLRALRPDLIVLSLSPAGQRGPLASLRGYGTTISALAGIDSLQGYRGGPPESIYTGITDPIAGTFGAFLVLAAVCSRHETGVGQHIDVAQIELGAMLTALRHLDYHLTGEQAGPGGNGDPVMSPHGLFPCRGEDNWIAIACATEEEWRALAEELSARDLVRDDRYADRARRWANRAALEEELARRTRDHDKHELAERLQGRGVRATPVLSPPELFRDPHFVARDNWVRVRHETIGDETIYGIVPKFGARTATVERAAHNVGADDAYVLGELLGLAEETWTATGGP
jgi:benzylsuccinate CoA-transferase BbsF subunit